MAKKKWLSRIGMIAFSIIGILYISPILIRKTSRTLVTSVMS